jgi:Fe-S-cluster-containing dehydrogenase component
MNGRVVMTIDLDRCWGCRACEVACKQELGLGVGPRPMRVLDSGAREVGGLLQRDFVPTLCQHCDNRAGDGTIQLQKEACIACGACSDACPFGVMERAGEGEPPVKCTLCRERRDAGGMPSCAQHCLGGAITLAAEDRLSLLVRGRHHWRTGRIVYLSDKWASLGEALPG